MKQKLLTVAVAAAAAFSMNAMADVSVYGKANLSLNQYDEADVVKVHSNASRVGVKGSYGISGSTKAVYKLEYQVDVDGDGSDLKRRNMYAGFAGDWGMVAAGHHDTPTKMAQGKVDRFNDLKMGDIKATFDQEKRAQNAIWYASPKANGLQGIIALVQGEKGNTAGLGADDDSIGDAVSASLTYDANNFYAAVAVDDKVAGKDAVRLVGEYKADTFRVGAMLQNSEPSEGPGDDTDSMLISGQVEAATNWIIKGQYSMAETGDAEKDLLTLGVDRKLNKKSKVFGYVSTSEYDDGVDGTPDTDETTFGIGYEVKF